MYNNPFDEPEWRKILNLARNVSHDSRIINFQYQLIHRILPTNRLLHIYKIKDNPFCTKCTNTEEDLEHLFHLCPVKLKIWYDLAALAFPVCDLFPYINTINILFGIYNEKKPLENSLLLLVKRYFFVSKCNNKEICLCDLIKFIASNINIEINLLNEKKKYENKLKWAPLIKLFCPP